MIQLLRLQQWAKNSFVFLPLFFHGQIFNTGLLQQCIVVFFAFSFAASSIYCFNDINDIDADRKHLQKCKRPIASGKVSTRCAYVIMAICLIVSVLILLIFSGERKFILIGIILLYYIMNVAYCLRLKHYAIVDAMVIAIGFVLRVFAGGYATCIELSEWIVLMTFLLALFLAFAKRRDDVILYQKTGTSLRNHLCRYNTEFLNQVMSIISTVTIVAYIMYTLSPGVTQRFGCKYVYLTSFFVLFGIIRYLQLSIVDCKSGSPTKLMMRDRFIQICIAGWITSFLIIIYL